MPLDPARAVLASPIRDHSYRETALGPDVVNFLAWMELGSAAPATLEQYERDLSRACLLFPDRDLTTLTDTELLQVVKSFLPKSRRVRKAAYDSFYRWAVRTRRVEKNPMELLPQIRRAPQKVIDMFSDTEIDDLMSLPLIDSALMSILIEGGLRKSEASNLQVRRLRLDEPPSIVVMAGKGGKDRLVPMNARLQQAVNELLFMEHLEPEDYLWYTRPGGGRIQRAAPIGKGSFAVWWRGGLAEAGVRYRNPHTARHTFATRWLRRGGRLETLSLVMGHASIGTTHDLYAHLDTSDILIDVARIDALA
jgi:integrase